VVNDGVLDALDAHRQLIDIECARRFTGCRADAPGELGKVVCAVQHLDSAFPVALVDQVVEVRNDVVDRTAVVAKRCAAVHAARGLLARLRVVQAEHELAVMLEPLGDGFVALLDALNFHKTCDFSHDYFLFSSLDCFFFRSCLRKLSKC